MREKKLRQKQMWSVRRSSVTPLTKRSQSSNRERSLEEMRSWGNAVELWGTPQGAAHGTVNK